MTRRAAVLRSLHRTDRARSSKCNTSMKQKGEGGSVSAGGSHMSWLRITSSSSTESWSNASVAGRIKKLARPTDPTAKPQNQEINVPGLHKIRRSPDFEALELWKGRQGVMPPDDKWVFVSRFVLFCLLVNLFLCSWLKKPARQINRKSLNLTAYSSEKISRIRNSPFL